MVAVITMAFIHGHFSFAFAVLFSYLCFVSILPIAYDVKQS
jgi:accessory gene regulator protein AgrB